VLRSLLWRSFGLAGAVLAAGFIAGLLSGEAGRALRGSTHGRSPHSSPLHALGALPDALVGPAGSAARLLLPAAACLALAGALLGAIRLRARAARRYVRLRVLAYRGDVAEPAALERSLAALHAALLRRWWVRALHGQPSVALEVHHGGSEDGGPAEAFLALCCPDGLAAVAESALRVAYPSLRLTPLEGPLSRPGFLVSLRKRGEFTRRTATAELRGRGPAEEPLVNALFVRMAACGGRCATQIALTPAPASFERIARRMFTSHEARLSRRRHEHPFARDRSLVDEAELRGGLEVQHAPLFFAEIRVLAERIGDCERIAAVFRARRAENRLVERRLAPGGRVPRRIVRRLERGEGDPLPSPARGVLAAREACELWQLPSVDFAAVPFARGTLPVAPAPPGVFRPGPGRGLLRDALGPVSIHPELRRQNTAVPGTVEQGKTSFLAASVAEDLRRERCAVIVLDPKGDAAEAALSAVPPGRTCTLLDFADPTCGFNPLAVDAPADVIADYVVSALKNLFSDADIRASSDRYLRNAIIAVLAADRRATLWDAARLLSVGEEGYAYRRAIAARVRALPELKEISSFFTAELTAQLADARSATTSKLDAPVNKLARLLNSPSIKRVLLNDSLRLDFDEVIAGCEVLVVKGALGAMGSGNTSVLMQLLVGMLDAALARRQDHIAPERRTAVALKIDEAPLVLNRGFAETMALKRSAGLETVACWQTDAQWVDREVRDQLDALFAHRVYFATASVGDARASAALTMAEFSDSVRPGVGRSSALGSPDVRLRLPRHNAIASWTTPDGRQGAFVAETIPMRIDPARVAAHAAAQAERGARRMTDLSQPHWENRDEGAAASAIEEAAIPAPSSPEPNELTSPEPDEPPSEELAQPPSVPAASYRELLELDRAGAARRVPAPKGAGPPAGELDAGDRQLLELIAWLGHVLSSQLHRRVNPGRAATTTQRRLRRLAEAGLVARLQLHRPDGGGVPMAYALTAAGEEALRGCVEGLPPQLLPASEQGREGAAVVRRAVHAAGWSLAYAGLVEVAGLSGAHLSVLVPPRGSGPASLELPGGRAPHEFLHTAPSGERAEAVRFQTLRPDATIALAAAGRGRAAPELLLDFDDRCSSSGWANRVERYDHFLAGWSELIPRYRRGGRADAHVVFVCRDRRRARECARRADLLLGACRAYGGEHPRQWAYLGRERMLWVAERDVHEGSLLAWRVPALPAGLREEEKGEEGAALVARLPAGDRPAQTDAGGASSSAPQSPSVRRRRSSRP